MPLAFQFLNRRAARIAGSVVLPVSLLMVTGLVLSAQVNTQSGLWIRGTDFKKPETSMVFVSAVSADWKPGQEQIMGYNPLALPQHAFSVFIDGKSAGEVQVTSFEHSDVGLDIVLAMDVSGSVYPNFEFVKRGVSAFVERRRQGKDQIAIVNFGTTVNVSDFVSGDRHSPFTGDVDSLKQFFSTPPSAEMRSRTVLFRAAADAGHTLSFGRLDASDARLQKVLYLFSDGHDEDTGFDVSTPIKVAKEGQIQVFCIRLPR